jgi:hypothetical protein
MEIATENIHKAAAQVVTRTETDSILLLALSAARDGSLSWARNFQADLRVKATKGGFLVSAMNEAARLVPASLLHEEACNAIEVILAYHEKLNEAGRKAVGIK